MACGLQLTWNTGRYLFLYLTFPTNSPRVWKSIVLKEAKIPNDRKQEVKSSNIKGNIIFNIQENVTIIFTIVFYHVGLLFGVYSPVFSFICVTLLIYYISHKVTSALRCSGACAQVYSVRAYLWAGGFTIYLKTGTGEISTYKLSYYSLWCNLWYSSCTTDFISLTLAFRASLAT